MSSTNTAKAPTRLSAKEQALMDTANAKATANGKGQDKAKATAALAAKRTPTPQVAALPGMAPLGATRTHPMPSKLAANAARTKAEEQTARASNDAKLAKAVRKQAPAKVLDTGSGALVGVAKGAMDGQPHTRQAVKEANARARTDLTLTPRQREAKAVFARLDAETGLQVMGTTFKSLASAMSRRAKIKAEMQTILDAGTKAAPAPKASATPPTKATTPTTPKVKAAKQTAPKADAEQKIVIVAKANPYREGTKAHATFILFTKCKTVGEARTKAEAAGGSGAAGKYDIGYLRYASRDGHIKFA